MRILYVVWGEARPRSWIIMIYGLAERGRKKSEKGRERGEEKEFLDDIIMHGKKENKTTEVAESFTSKTR